MNIFDYFLIQNTKTINTAVINKCSHNPMSLLMNVCFIHISKQECALPNESECTRLTLCNEPDSQLQFL
jgi:hypothetical protein